MLHSAHDFPLTGGLRVHYIVHCDTGRLSVCARTCEDTFHRGCFKEVRRRSLAVDTLPSTPPSTGEGKTSQWLRVANGKLLTYLLTYFIPRTIFHHWHRQGAEIGGKAYILNLVICTFANIGVGAQSTLGGKTFLPENICMKN